MTLSKVKQAFRLFQNDDAPKSTVKHNVRNYLRALEMLGDKWVLAKASAYNGRW